MLLSHPMPIQTYKYIKVIFISLFLLIFVNIYLFADDAGEQAISADGVSTVAIKSNNSSMNIIAWEQPKVMVRASGELSNMDIKLSKMEKDKDIIVIELNNTFGFIQSFDVFVPEEIDVKLNSSNGAISVTGIKGRTKVETVNGNIDVKDSVGSISAKTVNGKIFADIHFDGESDFASIGGAIDICPKDNYSVPITIHTVSGAVNIVLPSGYASDIDISTVSGQIISNLPEDVKLDGRSLRGKLFNGGPLLKVGTVSGAINIKAIQSNNTDDERDIKEPFDNRKKVNVIATKKLIDKSILPVIYATKTLSPPTIDGKLDDDSWKNAGIIDKFLWADGIGTPHKPTEAYLLWDNQNLYIGIRCHESNMDNIKINEIERDNEMWEDDNIQILIDSTPQSEGSYYHIAINPIGTIYDQEVGSVEIPRRKTDATQVGRNWNFNGTIDTDIRDTFWTIEISFPLASFMGKKPNANDKWRANFHRMEQQRKEYTYWSPTYSTPDWPHVPKKFGELIFSDNLPIKVSPEVPLPTSDSALAIIDIKIEGNEKTSENDIKEAMELKNGDIADVDILSSAKLRLESLGWFKNIGMELIQNDPGVKLVVKVIEKEIFIPSEINIDGANVFSKDELIDYFNLTTTKTTMQDIAVKCKLINELYRTKGYEMAYTKCSVDSNILQIKIDEGLIDQIEISGNKKIKTEEIIDSLAIKPGMPFKRNDIDSAINNMRYILPYFNSVNWKPRKSEDGSNIVFIEVKEGSLVKSDFDGISEFNRVHGLQLGLKPGISSQYLGTKAYFGFSYGFSSGIWNYQFGAEKSFFRHNKSTIAVDVHKTTDTNDQEIISNHENFIAEAILGEAFKDYYQREGFEVSLAQELPWAMKIDVKYRDDIYESLPKTNDWSLLNRFYADDVSKRSVKHKRDNPEILEGRMKSIIGGIVFDTRNNKESTTSGWYNRISIESSGKELGGDYDFTIYQADFRSYIRLSRSQLLAFRAKGATADRELERIHPRKFYLGGIGTLRGYSYKEFEGDTIFLMNAEYWLTLGSIDKAGLGVFLFADSGYAWKYNSEMTVDDLKTDIGIGFSFGSMPGNLTLTVATPIEEGNREPIIGFRLDRTF